MFKIEIFKFKVLVCRKQQINQDSDSDNRNLADASRNALILCSWYDQD
jgi:hypothetical protein